MPEQIRAGWTNPAKSRPDKSGRAEQVRLKIKSIKPNANMYVWPLLTRWAYHHTLLRKDASLAVVSTGSCRNGRSKGKSRINIIINMRTK